MVLTKKLKCNKFSDKLIIATTTFYNQNLEWDIYRAKHAKNTIKIATKLGYEIIVIDGGSSDNLLKEFEKCGAKIYSQKIKGMGNSRRQAIREAYNRGKEVIAWTEPEKYTYIPQLIKTAIPLIEGSADLVVPRRKLIKSYPTIQQHTESSINIFWKELTGTNLDICFGPRTWKRELSSYFLNYTGEYGDNWESIFIPIINAIYDNKKIINVEIEYTHPREQTKIEEHNLNFYTKRIKQLKDLTTILETHWKKLHFK